MKNESLRLFEASWPLFTGFDSALASARSPEAQSLVKRRWLAALPGAREVFDKDTKLYSLSMKQLSSGFAPVLFSCGFLPCE